MKKVNKIIVFGICILLFGSLGNFSDGRSAGLDYGGSGIPFSKNNTTVYLKSVNIYAILNYTPILKDNDFPYAIEDATYVFKNYGNNSIKINISLPFYFQPKNISLTVNGEPLNFNFGKDDINMKPFLWGFQLIYFYLEFKPFEDKKINVNYIRDFGVLGRTENGNTYRNFNYLYLTETGKCWNYSIEYAKFTFVIEKHENLEKNNFNEFEIEENETHFILSKEYNDWNFTENIIVRWTIIEKKEENIIAIIAIVVLIIVFILAIIFAFGYKKK